MVIDTGVFIEHLRAPDKSNTTLYLLPKNLEIFVSVITVYELYMGATDRKKHNHIKILLDNIPILAFDKITAEKSAGIYLELRSKNQIIDFRDIFIGATALQHNMPLKTLNKKHFNRIKDLLLH